MKYTSDATAKLIYAATLFVVAGKPATKAERLHHAEMAEILHNLYAASRYDVRRAWVLENARRHPDRNVALDRLLAAGVVEIRKTKQREDGLFFSRGLLRDVREAGIERNINGMGRK